MIPLTTSLILLLSTVTAQPALTNSAMHSTTLTASMVEATSTVNFEAEATTVPMISTIAPLNLESYVKAYYSKNPIMAKISGCESRYRQFDKTGEVLRGDMVKDDVGIMQINEHYHADEALKLGFDLHSLDGNLAFGQWLFDHQGTAPWSASAACWNK